MSPWCEYLSQQGYGSRAFICVYLSYIYGLLNALLP